MGSGLTPSRCLEKLGLTLTRGPIRQVLGGLGLTLLQGPRILKGVVE